MITNTQACVASVQTYSKVINHIAEDKLATIKLQVTSTNDPMVIIRAKGSTQQPPRNILLWAAAYDTVRKQTVLPLQDTKIENMMILKNRKIKLENEDDNHKRKPNSTSGIYLTAVKVEKCRQVAANRRETEEAKNITAKETSTRKINIQLKRSEAFDTCINSMNSLSLSNTDEYRFIQIIQQLYNIIKDAFVHIGGKLAELPNQRKGPVSREMIRIMK